MHTFSILELWSHWTRNNPCGGCSSHVGCSVPSIACTSCNTWFHISCTQVHPISSHCHIHLSVLKHLVPLVLNFAHFRWIWRWLKSRPPQEPWPPPSPGAALPVRLTPATCPPDPCGFWVGTCTCICTCIHLKTILHSYTLVQVSALPEAPNTLTQDANSLGVQLWEDDQFIINHVLVFSIMSPTGHSPREAKKRVSISSS